MPIAPQPRLLVPRSQRTGALGARSLGARFLARSARLPGTSLAVSLAAVSASVWMASAAWAAPNIVLVMADDQGWGETSYNHHPVLKTPHLDAMAKSGLRFDRFYAAAPVCSPTRASVLTGRTNLRTGVNSHGYALRLQERTLAQALQRAGYATGHFGKWHLNGLRGPGVPVLAKDTHHPGKFGFDSWLSVTNFFDRDPILSRQGEFVEFQGDSSEIVVDEAIQFIEKQATQKRPFFTVIWYGTPHSPFRAAPEDKRDFQRLDAASQDHYGELVAMDRSVGALRAGLRRLKIEDNTLVWFCSDNGGLPKIAPATTGGLRDFKGSLYEGGLRVPAVIEWPAGIAKPRVTNYPASTMDIFPTIAELAGLPAESMLQPQDGASLVKVFSKELQQRERPIKFRTFNTSAIVDNQYKLIAFDKRGNNRQRAKAKRKNSNSKQAQGGGASGPARRFELYDLSNDKAEGRDLSDSQPEKLADLRMQLERWESSVRDSVAGADYPEGKLLPENPEPRFWTSLEAYQRYFDQWRDRPEYSSRIKQAQRNPQSAGSREN